MSDNMVKCLNCGKENEDNSQFCESCGHDLIQDRITPKPNSKNVNKLLILIIAIIAVLVILLFIYSNNDNIVYSAGTYNVGVDIPAGDYKYIQTDPTGTECMLRLLENNSSSDIVGAYETNHKGASVYVHLDNNDTLDFKSGSLQSANNSQKAQPDEKGEFYDGIYKSGTDLEAGTYQLTRDTTGLNTNGPEDSIVIISNNPEYRNLDLNFLYEQLNYTNTSISTFDSQSVSFNNESQIDTFYKNGTVIMKDKSVIHTFLDANETYIIDIPEDTYVFIGNAHIKKV